MYFTVYFLKSTYQNVLVSFQWKSHLRDVTEKERMESLGFVNYLLNEYFCVYKHNEILNPVWTMKQTDKDKHLIRVIQTFTS